MVMIVLLMLRIKKDDADYEAEYADKAADAGAAVAADYDADDDDDADDSDDADEEAGDADLCLFWSDWRMEPTRTPELKQ